MSNPPNVELIRRRIYKALNDIEGDRYLELLARLEAEVPRWLKVHLEMEHTYPSPSNILRCRYQTWLNAKKLPYDQEIPPIWKIRQLMGIISEPLWLSILELAGFEVSLPNQRLECGFRMWAHPDAMLDDEYVFELKTINGWGYKRLLEASMGVAGEEEDHYAQAQLYLYAAKKKRCLYLATPPDPGFLQSTMRQSKRYGDNYEMPAIYLEWIEYDEATIENALQRAEMIAKDIESDEPPEREFDGRTHNAKGKRIMPCGFCLFSTRCQERYFDATYGDRDIEWVQ